MRTLRLYLVGTVILALLGGLGGMVVAQEGQEPASSGSATDEPLFEMTIPLQLMPTVLGKINLERHEVSPGFEASIGIENEAIRGKSLYLAEGELLVTPMVDAWAWRGGAADGGTPEVAVAGQPISLSTGDVIYLPAVPEDRLTPDATTVVANPGETTAVLLGHHAHDSSIPDRFPGWPIGMSGTADAVASDSDDLARVMASDAVYRLSIGRFEPGESITPDEDAAIVLARVESGVIDQLTVGPGGEISLEWPAGRGLSMDTSPREGLTYSWTAAGEEPLELLILAVTPVASQEAAE